MSRSGASRGPVAPQGPGAIAPVSASPAAPEIAAARPSDRLGSTCPSCLEFSERIAGTIAAAVERREEERLALRAVPAGCVPLGQVFPSCVKEEMRPPVNAIVVALLADTKSAERQVVIRVDPGQWVSFAKWERRLVAGLANDGAPALSRWSRGCGQRLAQAGIGRDAPR